MSEEVGSRRRDTELLKIEIYSERSHSILTTRLSYSITSVVGLLVLMYTLYYSQKISDVAFVSTVILLVGLLVFSTRLIMKAYDADFKKISNMIEMMNKGRNLSELEELKTWRN